MATYAVSVELAVKIVKHLDHGDVVEFQDNFTAPNGVRVGTPFERDGKHYVKCTWHIDYAPPAIESSKIDVQVTKPEDELRADLPTKPAPDPATATKPTNEAITNAIKPRPINPIIGR